MSIAYYEFSFDGLSTIIFSHADILKPTSLAGSYGPGPDTMSQSVLTMVLDEKAPSTVQLRFHPITPFALFDGVGPYAGSRSAYDPLRERLYLTVSTSTRYVELTPDKNTRGGTTIHPTT